MLFSCNTKQENKTTDKTNTQDTLAPLQITVIADLHDSLQPKTIFLDEMPAPKVIHAGKGETKMLPVLQNKKGEPVLDSQGKPFIMGDGGKSNFTNFTTDNGLALDGIRCLAIDQNGNLWFGTDGGGVGLYNGKTFSSITTAQGLANNRVTSILVEKNGNIWIGTFGGGVSRYDGKSLSSLTTAQGLAGNHVLSILEDKTGNLWFGTDGGGVSRYDGKSFTSFTTAQGLTNNTVSSIAEDKSGNLWFGTNGGGVSRYDGKTFTSYTTTQGLVNNDVRSITQDKTGKLWFGTNGGGISCYDGKTFTSFTTAQGLANNTVLNILEDKNENLWFGTDGGGVSRFNGKSFCSFTTAQGLANNTVLSILEDKSGNLWFGTFRGGMSRYDGRSFTSFTTTQGLVEDRVMSILEDKTGTLWFGTRGGVSSYDGRCFTSFTTAQGLTNNNVSSILEDKTGALWFGTIGGGVSRYNGNCEVMPNTNHKDKKYVPKSFTSFTTAQGLPSNSVYSILEDKKGNLWFGTFGGGVCRYDGNRVEAIERGEKVPLNNQQDLKKGKNGLLTKSFTCFTTAQGLANNSVLCILEDKTGILWFGTYGGGVSRFDGKSFTSFTTAQGLANNNVFSIFEDKKGNLWFGTEEGLSVISEQRKMNLFASSDKVKEKTNISDRIIKSFKVTDGLPDNFVTQVLQLRDGRIAVGTNLGITVLSHSVDLSKLTDIKIFNSNTGFPVKDVNVGQNGMYLDSKGIVWAATGSEKTALVRFDYDALRKSTEPPVLVIQSVKVKDENICWHDLQTKGIRKNYEDSASALLQEFFAYGKTLSPSENDTILKRFGNITFDGITKFYPIPENLVLPYEHNQIAFEFAAIETDRPFMVRYQYMLEGYDKNWSRITSRSIANFGNMNEGTYTFKLKAQGANGVWSKPIMYTFKVLPPWYRTWWAYLMYAMLFTGALQIFSKWRERRLRVEKEKLEKTVVERTEELVLKNAVVEKQKEELLEKNKIVEEQKTAAEKEKKRSDDLLLNILPEEVAEELKEKGKAEAKHFENVTVLFTDFVNFTKVSETLSPQELVNELHACFKAFDHIMDRYGIEKIKTIGDAYLAVCGLPIPDAIHAQKVGQAAIDICIFMKERRQQLGNKTFEIRVGINSGNVVAGIVGVKKFAYDVWGDTVNTAARMEQNSETGKINISSTTYELVKNTFNCIHRGKIQAKGKGEIDMYFLESRI